ncbi:MAG: hypothetical protein U0T79_12800 [Ferruginibacter sp.]
MKTTLLIALLCVLSNSLFAKNMGETKPVNQYTAQRTHDGSITKPVNVDPCLEAALNAIGNAFQLEQNGHDACANSVISGGIQPSEYGGCCYVFTQLRQYLVAQVINNFVPCPNGGMGII